MTQPTAVETIDHVELFVSDRDEAAAWYDRVLGLSVEEALERWAAGEGPLVLATADRSARLALFERETATRDESVSPRRVAFRIDGDGFLAFLDRLDDLDLLDAEGERVSPKDVVDHDLSYSLYFTDLDGNALELTTYDYESVTAELEST